MHRLAWRLLFAATLLASQPALRADVDAETFHRLESDVVALAESRDTQNAQIQKLRDELGRLRSENADLKQQLAAVQSKDVVSRDELKRVVEQLTEVDRRRAEDSKYVRTKLEEIATLAAKPPPLPPEEAAPPKVIHRKPPEEDPADAEPTEYFEHEVQPGETLGAIVAAYNKDRGLKVRVADVLKANPKIRGAKSLKVGSKLKIPAIKQP